MTTPVVLIPGDGIGPEISRAVLRVVESAGVKIEWETFKAGADAIAETGQALPDELMTSMQRNRVGLKGPTTTPIGGPLSPCSNESFAHALWSASRTA